MNKLLKIFIMISFVLLISACGKKGEEKEIILFGSDENYYNWTYTIDDDSVLSMASEKYYGDENSDDYSGLGGKYLFTIKALKKGETFIRFSYSKTWDETDELYNYDIKVIVDKDLKITISNEMGSYLALLKFIDIDRDVLGLDKPFNEYVLYFSDDPVDYGEYECSRLSVYTLDDVPVGYYAISNSNDYVFKVVDEEYILLNGD